MYVQYVCLTACHLLKVIILPIKFTFSFVKRTIVLSAEWLVPLEKKIHSHSICLGSIILYFIFLSCPPNSPMPSLICRFKFYHTFPHPSVFPLTLLIHSVKPLSALTSIVKCRTIEVNYFIVAENTTGSVLMLNIAFDLWHSHFVHFLVHGLAVGPGECILRLLMKLQSYTISWEHAFGQ